MDGKTNTEDKRSTIGDKLKSETTSRRAMRKKLRHGRADNSETLQEIVKREKLHKQGRKWSRADVELKKRIRKGINGTSERNEEEPGSAGEEALSEGVKLTQGFLYETNKAAGNSKKSTYAWKIHAKNNTTSDKQKEVLDKTEIKKLKMRERIHEAAAKKRRKEETKEGAVVIKEGIKKTGEAILNLLKKAVEYTANNPMVMVIAALVLVVVLVIGCTFSSCSVVFGSMNHVSITTSFTAEDDDILGANDDYTTLERQLQQRVNNIESEYPGMDEYRYNLDQVGHNPFELAALLTVLYEDYRRDEVQEKLRLIFNLQYELTIRETVERRTRTETRYHWVEHDGYESYESYTVVVEYDYHILTVTLKNNSMDSVARSIGLNEDQIARYEILLETFGNKKYLFEDDVYAAPNPGEYQDYDVPAELLTDVEFANMLHEAVKYLGLPYKWGGSSPSTGFDCSGFVSYVINHCGNGWNVGRLTANGLLSECNPISASEARPGDLIFFRGTYATSGASHVGIYVGNGMMIHCGNPIQFASVNTNYWRNHY